MLSFFSPNVYRTPSEALETFQWFDKTGDWEKHFATWERYLVRLNCGLLPSLNEKFISTNVCLRQMCWWLSVKNPKSPYKEYHSIDFNPGYLLWCTGDVADRQAPEAPPPPEG